MTWWAVIVVWILCGIGALSMWAAVLIGREDDYDDQ